MEYVTLHNGIKMPMIGFGTWDLHGKDCERAVLDAFEVGYRLIDTAQMYRNEREVGNAIQKATGKNISGRNGEEIIREFGVAEI